MANTNIVVKATLENTTIELIFGSVKTAKFVAVQLQKQNFDVTVQSQKLIEI